MTKDELKEKLSQISSDKDIYKKVKKFHKLCYAGSKYKWKSFVESHTRVKDIVMDAGCWNSPKNELGSSFFVDLYTKATCKGL